MVGVVICQSKFSTSLILDKILHHPPALIHVIEERKPNLFPEALRLCLEDTITDGKGMGFGLYTTSRLVDSIGKEFILHSGSHKLMIKDGQTSVIENGFWQGTLIYMEIGTSEEIDPNQIVDHRTDVAEEYNETFVETGELDSLW